MSKKRIFITGAGSGFGAAIARTAAERGWVLGLLVRDEGRFRRDFAEFARLADATAARAAGAEKSAAQAAKTPKTAISEDATAAMGSATDAAAPVVADATTTDTAADDAGKSAGDAAGKSTDSADTAADADKSSAADADTTAATVRIYTADVRDASTLKAAIDAFARDAGGIDYLINSAGLALGLGAFSELAAADADEMVDTNIKGTLNACRAAIAHIPHGGAIVNFGSIAGQYPYPGGHVYCGTKAFVQQFSEALRCDFAATGVRVSVIAPGLAKTNFSRTRFKGDEARAEAVYAHTNYLSAADVAAATFAVLDLPPHVNVTYFELMPQTQTPAALNTAPASFVTEFSGGPGASPDASEIHSRAEELAVPQGSPDASEIRSRAEELAATPQTASTPQTAATTHGAAK